MGKKKELKAKIKSLAFINLELIAEIQKIKSASFHQKLWSANDVELSNKIKCLSEELKLVKTDRI